MCGIVGYIGDRGATQLLLDGLKRLEYRGYDSAGIAILNGHGVETRKAAGKISRLEAALVSSPIEGNLGIAHTRWATHGAPTECNAHPHMDCKGNIAVVHNGIIENSTTLKAHLTERGHKFVSDTDTEVLAHLIEEAFDGSLEDAVIEALWQVGRVEHSPPRLVTPAGNADADTGPVHGCSLRCSSERAKPALRVDRTPPLRFRPSLSK